MRGTRLQGASVEVGEGEVVGLAGLLGSGRSETGPRHLRGRSAGRGRAALRRAAGALSLAERRHQGGPGLLQRGPQGRGHRARTQRAREPDAGAAAALVESGRGGHPRGRPRSSSASSPARHQDLRPRPADSRAVGRQPAKSAAGPLAGHEPAPADSGRTHARHRRGSQGRDSAPDRRAGRRGPGRADDFQRTRRTDRGLPARDGAARRAHRGRTWRATRSARPQLLHAMAQGLEPEDMRPPRRRCAHERRDQYRRPPGPLGQRRSGPARRPETGAAQHPDSAGPADLQRLLHALLPERADPQRQFDAGGDHHHRGDGHDAGHRHRRRGPLGRLVDGDQRRAGSADLPEPGLRQPPGAGHRAGLRGAGAGGRGLRGAQRPVRDAAQIAADRGDAGALHRRARHRPGHHQRAAPELHHARLHLHRAGPTLRRAVSGHPDADHRGDHLLGGQAHGVWPLRAGGGRQRDGGGAVGRAGLARQARGLRHQRTARRASRA